jgi:hypothetical protein
MYWRYSGCFFADDEIVAFVRRFTNGEAKRAIYRPDEGLSEF